MLENNRIRWVVDIGALVILLTGGGYHEFIHEPEIKALASAKYEALSPASSEFRWESGEPDAKMIAVSEGICYLTHVSGQFGNRNRNVSIKVLGEWWYLSGSSDNIEARARCWKFPLPSEF